MESYIPEMYKFRFIFCDHGAAVAFFCFLGYLYKEMICYAKA